MKSLAQIEPRTLISSLPYTIASSGSYYLTANLSGVASSDGISIQASDVTLDLNGFVISGGMGSLSGINIGDGQANVIVRNGTLRNWQTGIAARGAANCAFIELRLSNNAATGLAAGTGSVVRDTMAMANHLDGIAVGTGSQISGSTSSANTGNGITAADSCVVTACSAFNNSSSGVVAGADLQIDKCKSSGNGATGISAGADAAIHACTASGNLDSGIVTTTGAQVLECKATSNTKGILVQDNSTVRGCVVLQSSGDGILVTGGCTVNGNQCKGNFLARDAAGIHATGTRNTIEQNVLLSNDWGLRVEVAGNLILRNAAANNSLDYSIGSDPQSMGPVLYGDGFTTDVNPAANFQF
jgi:hypothetical protein